MLNIENFNHDRKNKTSECKLLARACNNLRVKWG